MVRQTADVMRRHGLLDEDEHARVQALGRDMGLLVAVGAWYRAAYEQHITTRKGSSEPQDDGPGARHRF